MGTSLCEKEPLAPCRQPIKYAGEGVGSMDSEEPGARAVFSDAEVDADAAARAASAVRGAVGGTVDSRVHAAACEMDADEGATHVRRGLFRRSSIYHLRRQVELVVSWIARRRHRVTPPASRGPRFAA